MKTEQRYTYRIYFSVYQTATVDVEAGSLEEAEEIANNMDPASFMLDGGHAEYDMDHWQNEDEAGSRNQPLYPDDDDDDDEDEDNEDWVDEDDISNFFD